MMSAAAERTKSALGATPRNLQALDTWLCSLEAFVEKYYWTFGSGLVGAIFIYLLYKDLRLHLWADEIATLYIAKLASVSAIIEATLDGVDWPPPLYSVICHLLLPIAPESLAVRLPSTIGLCAMAVGLLDFLRHRLPALYAFVAVLLAYQLAFDYGTEGRGYGLILGIAGLSLVCWRNAADGRNRVLWLSLLALCSGVMSALHYFTIFFAAACCSANCFVGERAEGSISRFGLPCWRRSDLCCALHYPFIVVAQRYSAHFWSTAHIGPYRHLYGTSAIALLVVFLAAAFLPAARSSAAPVAMSVHELAAIIAIAVAPIVLIVLFKRLGATVCAPICATGR